MAQPFTETELNRLTETDCVKIKMIAEVMGLMTSQEALDVAVHADFCASGMSWLDPSRARFIHEREGFLQYAELLERIGR